MIFNSGGGGSSTAMTTQQVEDAVDAAFPAPSTYSVQVSLTNPISPQYFESCIVYEIPTLIQYDQSNWVQIGSIASADGNGTFEISQTSYGIGVAFDSISVLDLGGATIDCTGGVNWDESTQLDYADAYAVEVTADGTITIDGINYYD